MVTGWLIYRKEDAEKNERYIEFYKEEGKKRQIDIRLIYTDDLEIGVFNHKWELRYKGQQIHLPDFAVCRTIAPIINKQLELMGVPVFNNSKVARICNDKALTYQYVAQLGIPMVDTIFCRQDTLEEQLKRVNGPTVFKAIAGHGGSQVFLYDPEGKEALQDQIQIRKGLEGCDFVRQPFTGNRHQDLRVYVIGRKIVAAVLRTAKNGFKSNFSLGGQVELYELSVTERELVNQIIELFDFGMVGIDFIVGDDGSLIFNEIEDVVGARMLYQCSDLNLVGLYLDEIASRIGK